MGHEGGQQSWIASGMEEVPLGSGVWDCCRKSRTRVLRDGG